MLRLSIKMTAAPLIGVFAVTSVSGGEALAFQDPEVAPTVELSMDRVPAKRFVDVTGSGFTPSANVTSHLLQPDGREFPFLPMLTDSDGGFTHEVDTLLLLVGVHELWVVDDTTGVSSNVARFEVTREQETEP